ncbi:MAG: ABC-three component system middle component 8 [Nanoarchaeota archaeon]
MIKPDELMDIDISILRISSIILKKLKRERMIGYPDILNFLIKKEGENVRFVFLNSLIFLYALGKVIYHIKTDSLEIQDDN